MIKKTEKVKTLVKNVKLNYMEWKIKIVDINDFQKFILSLDKKTQAKLTKMIDLLGGNGVDLKMPYARQIGDKMWELRILGSQQARIIYVFRGAQIIILNWFLKKSNKIPNREIETARKRLTL
jgi:phage-related protein